MNLTERAETRRETFYKLTNSATPPTVLATNAQNLLLNSPVNADNLRRFGASNATISVVTKDNRQAYKISVTTSGGSGAFFNGNAGYYNLIKDRLYTFSFYTLTNIDKSYSFNSLGHIQAINENGNIVGSDKLHQHSNPVYSTSTIKANTWTKVWCTFRATSNSYFKPYFWYLNAGDEIYINNMMLNEGDTPLPYIPAPEDYGWSKDPLVPTQSNRYLWKFEYIYFSDGSVEIAGPVNLSIAGQDADATEAINKTKQELLEKLETVRDDSLAAVDEAKQQLVTVRNESLAAAEEAKQGLINVNTKVDNAKAELTQAKQQITNVASELTTAKQDLADSVSAVNTKVDNAKAELTQAKQQLTTVSNDLSKAKTDFQNAVSAVDTKATNLKNDLTQAKQDLNSQAQQLQTQANAQSELTKRVSSVEKTANGTKTTVSELSKTVAQNGKDITSVTARTKTVEDDLAGTKTTLSQVKTTADSTSQKTATLETGLNGLNAKFDNLRVGGANLLLYSADPSKAPSGYYDFTGAQKTSETYNGSVVYRVQSVWKGLRVNLGNLVDRGLLKVGDVLTYSVAMRAEQATPIQARLFIRYTNQSGAVSPTGKIEIVNLTADWQYVSATFTVTAKMLAENTKVTYLGWELTSNAESGKYVYYACNKIERGNVATDYTPNESDLEQKVAEYKQNADQNYASLSSTVQTLDGQVQSNKATAEQTAQGFKTRIESLETYKDGESTRANQYFELAKTETARQLTAERTAIAKDYVAKSTYTSDVTGIRNDLTATTATANTIKTNLANYQASNDRAVANLQSNLQEANGNISSLKTKVEAVPGQITSAVSAVEGKIPTNVSTRNLILKSNDFANPHKATGDKTTVTSTNDYFVIRSTGYTADAWGGMSWNMSISEMKAGEQFSILMPVYIDSSVTLDNGWGFSLKNHPSNSAAYDYTIPTNKKGQWFNVAITFKVYKDVVFDTYPFYVYLNRNGLVRIKPPMLVRGNLIPSDYQPAFEDTDSDITKLNTTLTQTADGLKQLTTQVTSQGGTITSHTNSINSLTTGLQAKVSQSEFNTLSGRVTTAENNIIAKANELSSKISSVEGKIPTSFGGRNLLSKTNQGKTNWSWNISSGGATIEDFDTYGVNAVKMTRKSDAPVSWSYIQYDGLIRKLIEPDTKYTLSFDVYPTENVTFTATLMRGDAVGEYTDLATMNTALANRWTKVFCVLTSKTTLPDDLSQVVYLQGMPTTNWNWLVIKNIKLEEGVVSSDWSPAPEDTVSQISSLSSEIKQTTDAIKASVSSLDNSTVKSSSLTINADGIVMKAGKSTTDVANAIGSYFAVNQNAINLFSDKINVKGNMIVNGAITSNKIAAGAITADKIAANSISSDKIVSSGITADVIKSGVLKAANDAMQINLNSSNITFSKDASVIFTSSDNALKRVIADKPSQFIKMYDDNFVSELGLLKNSTLTVVGSNADRTESSDSSGFGGLRVWNGRSSTDNTSFVELVGNRVAIYGNKNRSPWLFDMTTTTSILIPQNSNGIKHSLGRSDRPFYSVYADNMYIQGERVAMMLKDIALHIGYGGNNGWVGRIQ